MSSAVDRMVAAVAEQVSDPHVLRAMREVPREAFVPAQLQRYAYEDTALAIGAGQTISQPRIVGAMTEALALRGDEHVLEVGTGSGYQAALLARLAADVVTVERVDALRLRAQATLARLGVTNVRCLPAVDVLGAPGHAPYDAIVVTAAAPGTPHALLEQLREGGRLVIPVGSRSEQELLVVTKHADGVTQRSLGPCRFVPLLGRDGFPPSGGPRAPGQGEGAG